MVAWEDSATRADRATSKDLEGTVVDMVATMAPTAVAVGARTMATINRHLRAISAPNGGTLSCNRSFHISDSPFHVSHETTAYWRSCSGIRQLGSVLLGSFVLPSSFFSTCV